MSFLRKYSEYITNDNSPVKFQTTLIIYITVQKGKDFLHAGCGLMVNVLG